MAYEWIDNLNFIINPNDCLENTDEYISIAKQRFLEDGWDGDGDIELMWVPPFMLKQENQWAFTNGITVWHVNNLKTGLLGYYTQKNFLKMTTKLTNKNCHQQRFFATRALKFKKSSRCLEVLVTFDTLEL